MPKKVTVVDSLKCNLCDSKEKEIAVLKSKVFQLENENGKVKKDKKQLSDEEIQKRREVNEQKIKERQQREDDYKKAIDENKKLKNELLMKFGVNYN